MPHRIHRHASHPRVRRIAVVATGTPAAHLAARVRAGVGACLVGCAAACFAASVDASSVRAVGETPAAPAASFEDVSIVVNGFEAFVSLPMTESAPRPVVRAALVDELGAGLALAAATVAPDGSASLAFVTSGVAAPRRPVLMRPGLRLQLTAGDAGAAENAARFTAGDPDARGNAAGFTAHGQTSTGSGMRAASSHSTLEITIPNLTADVDTATGRLTGQAPAGVALGITARRADGTPASPLKTTAGADGAWQVDVGQVLPLDAGARGVVFYHVGSVTVQRAWAVAGLKAEIGGETVTAYTVPGDVLDAAVAVPGSVLDMAASVPKSALTTGRGVPWTAGSTMRADGATQAASSTAVAWDGTATLVLRDGAGRPLPLASGAMLAVRRQDGPPLSLVTEATQVRLDPSAERVTGRSGRRARLVATLSEPGRPSPPLRREIMTGAEGVFQLDLAGDYDVTAATRLVLTWPDAPGLSLTAYAPRLTRRDALAAILDGQGMAGEVMAARMVGPGGALLAEADGRVAADGHFRLVLRAPGGRSQAPATWLGDGQVSLTHGGEPIATMDGVMPLHVEASAAGNTISGANLAPGTLVTVTVGDAARSVLAGVDGAWAVETGDWADLRPGTGVGLQMLEASGVQSELDFPVFRLSAQPGSDRVRAEGPPGVDVSVELGGAGGTAATGRCTVSRQPCDASLFDAQGRPAILRPGDNVSGYPSTGDSADIEVQKLNAHIDPGGNDVVGEGPPGEPVRVEFTNREGLGIPQGGSLGTDANGVYDFELRSSEHGLMVPGLASDVFLQRPDGHQVWARGVLEQVQLTPGSAEVRGLVEPMTRVITWLNNAGESDPRRSVAHGEAASDRDGRFVVRLADSANRPMAVAVGQTVGVSHARAVRNLIVPPLFAWHRGAASSIVGQTGAGLAVKAIFTLVPGALATAGVDEEGLVFSRAEADAGGFFELELPVLDPADIARVEVVATMASGDEIRMALSSDARGSTVYLPSAAR